MSRSAHFPSVRLATAGYLSLLLLTWLAVVPTAFPPLDSRHADTLPVPTIVSAGVSLLILVILAPVFWHGPWRNRWLAVLPALFPALTFAVTALWLLSWLF